MKQNIKKILYYITYKISFPPFRKILKKKYKQCKYQFSFLDFNEFWLIKKNGEKVRNPKIDGLNVEFYGKDSVVEIYEPYNFENCCLKLRDDNLIQIQSTNYIIKNLQLPVPMREHSQLIIGKDLSCIGCSLYMHDEPNTKVIIGDDCMFSFDIIIWPSDGHAIISDKGEYLNKGENITIGNHVWLGMGVNVLKGSHIPDNSIIAARSVVLKSSTKASTRAFATLSGGGVFAGIPARLVKSGAFSWVRETCYDHSIGNYVLKDKK